MNDKTSDTTADGIEPLVLLERDPAGYAVVTLNRPRQRNALNRELRADLAQVFDRLARDERIRVVILTGAGPAFCAGLDLKELGSRRGEQGAQSDGVEHRDPVTAMAAFAGPIIGAINGSAVTGGFEIALACDVLVASTEARFADTHARVGILAGWGLSQRLSRRIGIGRAKELSFSGNYLDAETAERWGLVNRVVAPGELLPACRALACDMLSVVPEALVGYKRLIDEGYALPFGEAMAFERSFSSERNSKVTGNDVESRRAGIVERGRRQRER